MSCRLGIFVAGALVGASAALLMAPEKGEDLRKKIRKAIKKVGVEICDTEEELDAIVEELAEEIKAE